MFVWPPSWEPVLRGRPFVSSNPSPMAIGVANQFEVPFLSASGTTTVVTSQMSFVDGFSQEGGEIRPTFTINTLSISERLMPDDDALVVMIPRYKILQRMVANALSRVGKGSWFKISRRSFSRVSLILAIN